MRKSKKVGVKFMSAMLAAGMLVQNAAAYVNVINSYTPPSPDFGSGSVYNITLSNTSDKESTNVNFTHSLPDGVKINGDGGIQSSCGNVTVENNGNNGVIKLTNGKIRGMVNGINGSCTISVNVLANKVGTFVSTFRVGDVTAITNGNQESNRDSSSATLVQTIRNMNISIFGKDGSNMNKGDQKEIIVRLQNLNNKELTNVSINSIRINDAFRVVNGSGISNCGGNVDTSVQNAVSASGLNIGANQTCEIKFKIESVSTQDADHIFTKIVRTFGTLTATSVSSDQGSVIDHDVDSNTMQVYSGLTVKQQFNEGTTDSGANIVKAVGQDKDTDITFTFKNNDTTEKTGVSFTNRFSPSRGNNGTITFKEVVENTCGGNISGQGSSNITMNGLTVPAAQLNTDGENSGECKVVARLTVNSIGTYDSSMADEHKYINSKDDGDKASSLYTKYDSLSLVVTEPGDIGITKKYVPVSNRDKEVGIYAFGDDHKYHYTITNLSNSVVSNINFADYYSRNNGNRDGTIVSENEDFVITNVTNTCGGNQNYNETLVKGEMPFIKGQVKTEVSGFSLNPGQSCEVEVSLRTNINQIFDLRKNGEDINKDYSEFTFSHRTYGTRISYDINGQNKKLTGNDQVTNFKSKFPLKVSEYYKDSDLAGANSYIDIIVNKRGEYELRNFDHKVELHEGFTLLSKDIEYVPNDYTGVGDIKNIAGTCDKHSKDYYIEGNVGDNTFRLKNNSIPATDINENILDAGITEAKALSYCKMRIKVKVPKIDTANKRLDGIGTNPAQDYGSILRTADRSAGIRVTDIQPDNERNSVSKYLYHRSNTNIIRSDLVANKSFNPERIKGGEKSIMKITLQNDFGTSEDVVNGSYTENFNGTNIQLHPEADPKINIVKGTCEGVKFNVAEDRSSIGVTGLNIKKGSVCEITFNVTGKLEGNVISRVNQGDFSSENGPYNTNNSEATIQIEPSVFVYEKFDVPEISTGQKTNLNVEIFNTKNTPAVDTITDFANVFPKGIEAVRQISNTCGGNVEITKNQEGISTVTLTNGNNLPAGGSCKIVTEVTGVPGNYLDTIAIGDVHTASNVPNYNATEAPLVIKGKVITTYKDKECKDNPACNIPDIANQCEGTQVCEAIEIPPYRTPNEPPVCVPQGDVLSCTYYYEKPIVITTYKDKECKDNVNCNIPDLANECRGTEVCKVIDIPPYNTPNEPATCVEKNGETHCTYYYEKPTVITTYKDKECKDNPDCNIPDLAERCTGTQVCLVKEIPPYNTPNEPAVCVQKNGNTECTYYYEKPTIITTYKDKECKDNVNCNIPDLADECTGKDICKVKEIPPYETPNTPAVCTDTPRGKVCTYYYEKQKGSVIVRFLEDNTNSILHRNLDFDNIKYGDNYDVSVNNNNSVRDADTKVKQTHNYVRFEGEQAGTINSKVRTVTYYYTIKNNVPPIPNIPTFYRDEECRGNNNCTVPDLAPRCTTSTDIAACEVIDIPGYVPPRVPQKEGNEWVYYYKKKEGNIIVKYLDKATNKSIDNDYTFTDKVNKDYNVTDKKKNKIGEYTYDSTKGNEQGRIVEGDTVIIYYYTKPNKPSIPSIGGNPPGPGGYVVPPDPRVITPVPPVPSITPKVEEKITEYREKITGNHLLPECKAKEPCPVKEIPGYEFIETKTEGNKTIHYYNKKIEDGRVFIRYVDVETFTEIKNHDLITGRVGNYYDTTKYVKDDVEGYKLIGVADFDVDEVEGEIKAGDITVVYIYERVKLVPKIPTPQLPKTGVEIKNEQSDKEDTSDNYVAEVSENKTENIMNYVLIAIISLSLIGGGLFFLKRRKESSEE